MSTRPQAYHAGIQTFMRRPMAGLDALRPGMVAVLGVPFDATSGSRPGATVRFPIDVVSCAYAPGTRGVVLDGLEPRQLFEAVEVLARYPVGALDVVEVAPNYDGAESTIRLAAQALFQLIIGRAGSARPGK